MENLNQYSKEELQKYPYHSQQQNFQNNGNHNINYKEHH